MSPKFKGKIAALAIGLTTFSVSAENFETGKQLFEQEAVDQAVVAWETAARAGDIQAQRSLAMVLLNTRLDYFDAENGVAWLIQAADAGDAKSAHWLALIYVSGKYAQQDLALAKEYLDKAIAAGSTAAKTLKGFWMEIGLTGKPDLREAVLNYHQAAQAGDPEAQYQLARCYAKGIGIPPDANASNYWLKEASRSGHKQAGATLQSGEF